MSDAATRKGWRNWALRVAGTVLVVVLLFRILPFHELWAAMRRISLPAWLAALAAYTALNLIATIKWRMMVNVAGAGLSYSQAARCFFAGLFGNVFTPSVVGGDIFRAGLAMKMGRSKAGVLLGSVLDRMLDIVALGSVAGTGALLIPGHLDPQLARGFWLVMGVLGLGGVAALGLVWVVLRRRFSFRIRRKLVRLRTAARKMARQPGRVALALSVGVFVQAGLVVVMSRVAVECGLYAPLSAWLFAYPMAKLVALVPVTQGGIGVREAALAALLVPFGAPPVLTVAAGFVWQTILISTALAGGPFVFFAGGSSRPRPESKS